MLTFPLFVLSLVVVDAVVVLFFYFFVLGLRQASMLPLLRRPSLKDLLRHTREAVVCEMDLSHQRVMRDGGVLRIQPLQASVYGRALIFSACSFDVACPGDCGWATSVLLIFSLVADSLQCAYSREKTGVDFTWMENACDGL